MDAEKKAELEREIEHVRLWASENMSFEQLTDAYARVHVLYHATQRLLEKSSTGPFLAELRSALHAMKSHIESERLQKIQKARSAADARHGKPGGSRDKQDQIRKIWASGKYSSRDLCAEQECATLNLSFSTARRALRGTPDPT